MDRGEFHVEHGDAAPTPLSFLTRTPLVNTVQCWQLHTTDAVHAAVRGNITRSPLYNGAIKASARAIVPPSKTR